MDGRQRQAGRTFTTPAARPRLQPDMVITAVTDLLVVPQLVHRPLVHPPRQRALVVAPLLPFRVPQVGQLFGPRGDVPLVHASGAVDGVLAVNDEVNCVMMTDAATIGESAEQLACQPNARWGSCAGMAVAATANNRVFSELPLGTQSWSLPADAPTTQTCSWWTKQWRLLTVART